MPAHDLISHAARLFVLAERASRLDPFSYIHFWDVSARLAVGTASHLPPMAAAVGLFASGSILSDVVRLPLPGVLPPEAVPWHNRLVAAWEVHLASSYLPQQNLARLALVRLDGCGMPDGHGRPSRLPEWLADAQKIVGTGPEPARTGERRIASRKVEALAALATWRPAPGVITPPETLRAWVNFWLEIRQSKDPVEKGLAAIALLNLPEADLRAASIPPVPAVELLPQVTTAIEVAAERKDPDYLSLLDWQPVKETTWPVAEVENVAQAWLEVTSHKDWRNRRVAWRQLIRWDRAGSLAIGGMDLLPELVQAVPTEGDGWVLWEMAQWSPAAERFTSTGPPDSRSQLQQLEGAWKQHRTSWYVLDRAAAWLAGIRLHQAGLASEPPESFWKAWLSTLAGEEETDVLFILAQWTPGVDAPQMWHRDWHAAWQQWFWDGYDFHRFHRQIAAWALLRQSIEKGHDRSLRCTALELWRAGTKASSEVKDTLNVIPSRLHEVRARLAAGEVVDFEGKPVPPAERHHPPLALPPGRIADGEWQMENEKWNMENEGMKHQEVTPEPNLHLWPDSPSG